MLLVLFPIKVRLMGTGAEANLSVCLWSNQSISSSLKIDPLLLSPVVTKADWDLLECSALAIVPVHMSSSMMTRTCFGKL